jgi:TPR repeat protein
MYNIGLGVRKDSLEASKWFIWAAEQGGSNAQFYLSQFRFDGVTLHEDEKEGLDWLNKPVRQRNVKACYTPCILYFEGRRGIEEDRKSGLVLLKFAVENGFLHAQLVMANRYQKGDGAQKNLQKCINCYEMACDAGSGKAHYKLAVIYFQKWSFFKARTSFVAKRPHVQNAADYSETVKIFIYITENNINDLHYLIGYHYDPGTIAPYWDKGSFDRIYTKAIKWYLAASNNGDSRANYRLGMMHEYGKGVDKNLDKAIHYYQMGALKENSDAGYRLACFYLKGYGVTRDFLKAFCYYSKASILGHEDASEALIVPKDRSEIQIYYSDSRKYGAQMAIGQKPKSTC